MALTNQLKQLLRTAHYIAVQCRPISDYISPNKLDKAKGVVIGDSYLNVYRIDSTSGVTELYNDISRFSFISVIADGSTDNSSIEQEMLCV